MARDAARESRRRPHFGLGKYASEYVATPASIARTTEAMRGGYVSAFWYVLPTTYIGRPGPVPLFLRCLGIMLIGMALFRSGV